MKFSTGNGYALGTVKTVEMEWPKLASILSTHKVGAKSESFFVGGYFTGTVRDDDYMVARTMLTLDIDDPKMTLAAIELQLTLGLDCAFVAYSTYSHTAEHPRVRVVIPLSRELDKDDHRTFAEQVGGSLDIPLDPCSYKFNQLMYSPRVAVEGKGWSLVQTGEPMAVPDVIGGVVRVAAGDDDLSVAIAAQPLDLTREEVDGYLTAYPAEGLDYDEWLGVGMAIYHQLGVDAMKVWVDWSTLSGKHDASQMRVKWRSFGGAAKPITFATIIYKLKKAGGVSVSEGGGFDALLSEADKIETHEQYQDFKRRVSQMSIIALPKTMRDSVVSKVAEGFGKAFGIRKTSINSEMSPVKRTGVVIDGDSDGGEAIESGAPEWMKPWIYIEKTCEFHNMSLNYSIRREAFNAKFDRKTEVLMADKPASQFALVDCRLPCVVDVMFFPGAAKVFLHEGRRMLNTYADHGVDPCSSLDDEGAAVVSSFIKHVQLTLASEDEQELLINVLAYVVQNPGKRIRWATLLQGAQGIGKSYFGNVLEAVLGSNVASLDPSAIHGRFTGWAHGSLVVIVEEVRVVGTNKFEVLDKLKPIITNQHILIEEKGRDHRTVPNFTTYILFTNHKDAIPLQSGERRYAVLFSRIQTEEELFEELGGEAGASAYFDELFGGLARRPDALSHFLRDWKISDNFDPNGRAPNTSAKQQMKDVSVSSFRDVIEDAIEIHACDVIGTHILDITWLRKLVEGGGGELPKTNTLTAILSEMGYSPIEGRRIKVSGNGYHYLWVGREMSKLENFCEDLKVVVRKFHGEEKAESF